MMKMRLFPILFLFLLSHSACTNKKTILLGDLMEADAIEQVRMSNNSGTFYLDGKQLETFKEAIKTFPYEPGFAAKVGAIQIELTIRGKTCSMSSATHGNYVEVARCNITKNDHLIQSGELYFQTNGFNFDHFQPAN